MASTLDTSASTNMRALHAKSHHADVIGTGAIAYVMRWAT